MEQKSGLWALLATACAVTGLVVLAGFLVVPEDSTARLSAADLHPTDGAGWIAGPQQVEPRTDMVAVVRRDPAVTLTRKARGVPQGLRRVHPPPPVLQFRISSFNVLGSSHTDRGGTHARYAPGRVRMQTASDLVTEHGVDVVGFQEMQSVQLAVFLQQTNGAYDVWPGFARGRLNTENSLAWRRDMWTAVDRRTFSIPYFRGHARLMPLVRLRNRSTGVEAWFLNAHNPASTRHWGNNQRWRDAATRIETDLVNRLRATDGIPVFFTGDLNEHAQAFCRVVGSTDLEAAMGGSADAGCRPPRIRFVDWIFGSPEATFTNYTEDTSQVVRHTSDHPLVYSDVRIEGHPPAAGSTG